MRGFFKTRLETQDLFPAFQKVGCRWGFVCEHRAKAVILFTAFFSQIKMLCAFLLSSVSFFFFSFAKTPNEPLVKQSVFLCLVQCTAFVLSPTDMSSATNNSQINGAASCVSQSDGSPEDPDDGRKRAAMHVAFSKCSVLN